MNNFNWKIKKKSLNNRARIGKISTPHKEKSKCKPNSYYGIAKLKATNYVKKSNIPNCIMSKLKYIVEIELLI